MDSERPQKGLESMRLTSTQTNGLSTMILDLDTQELDMDLLICNGLSLGIKRIKKETLSDVKCWGNLYLSTNTFT